MNKNNFIEVQNLFCTYNSKVILRNINFKISSGEAVAIIGKSGSGKTTLAYCLTGIIPHRIPAKIEGEIKINDKSYGELSFRDIIKNINIVLEDYEAQIFGLTVEEELAFGLENLGLPTNEIENRINWALKTFNLIDKRKMLVSELSGGLKQRLAIASTVILKPNFLVLDNPTANLDWNGILRLKEIINELKSYGCGLILMLRKIKGFEDCIDKVYFLNSGSLKEVNYDIESSFNSIHIDNYRHNSENELIIRVEDLWFKYNGPYVLKGINLDVYGGEVLAVMGSNGSGKTTLMKHLNGLLKPCKGRVIVCGMDTKHYSASSLAKIVGLAFQDPNKHLFANTVWDEVSFGCKVLKLPMKNVVEALKLLKLYDLKDKGIHELSMGEKVRVVIASALALNPKVLILDEPTTGQDSDLLVELAKLILKLKSNGKSIVIVTHDSDFALQIADKIAILINGELKYLGSPSEILFNDKILSEACLEPPSNYLR